MSRMSPMSAMKLIFRPNCCAIKAKRSPKHWIKWLSVGCSRAISVLPTTATARTVIGNWLVEPQRRWTMRTVVQMVALTCPNNFRWKNRPPNSSPKASKCGKRWKKTKNVKHLKRVDAKKVEARKAARAKARKNTTVEWVNTVCVMVIVIICATNTVLIDRERPAWPSRPHRRPLRRQTRRPLRRQARRPAARRAVRSQARAVRRRVVRSHRPPWAAPHRPPARPCHPSRSRSPKTFSSMTAFVRGNGIWWPNFSNCSITLRPIVRLTTLTMEMCCKRCSNRWPAFVVAKKCPCPSKCVFCSTANTFTTKLQPSFPAIMWPTSVDFVAFCSLARALRSKFDQSYEREHKQKY